jgi:aromatic ring hydroxylase
VSASLSALAHPVFRNPVDLIAQLNDALQDPEKNQVLTTERR